MSRGFRFVAAAAAGLLLTGCASGGGERVAVEKDSTDVVFGASTTTSTPALNVPPGDFGPTGDLVTTLPPHHTVTQPSPALGACVEAGPTTAIDKAAGAEVVGHPAVGAYRWIATGDYTLPSLSTAQIPLLSPFTHYVRRVAEATDSTPHVAGAGPSEVFTYQTLDPRVGGGMTAFTWQVKTDSADPTDLEAGLVLRQIDVLDNNGALQSTYFKAASNGLLFFPLTVKPGTTWTSTSVDPTHGLVVVRGQVLARQTVDACGKIAEGWQTKLSLRDGTATSTLDMLVAPQYGAQIISLKISGSYLGVDYSGAEMHIGQLAPSPLPSRLAS